MVVHHATTVTVDWQAVPGSRKSALSSGGHRLMRYSLRDRDEGRIFRLDYSEDDSGLFERRFRRAFLAAIAMRSSTGTDSSQHGAQIADLMFRRDKTQLQIAQRRAGLGVFITTTATSSPSASSSSRAGGSGTCPDRFGVRPVFDVIRSTTSVSVNFARCHRRSFRQPRA